jgi:hypothetical protein
MKITCMYRLYPMSDLGLGRAALVFFYEGARDALLSAPIIRHGLRGDFG